MIPLFLSTNLTKKDNTFRVINKLPIATAIHDAGTRELVKKVLEASRRKLGNIHPEPFNVMSNLATSYSNLGDRQEVMKLREKVFEAGPKTMRGKFPGIFNVMNDLANSYSSYGVGRGHLS